MRPERIWKVSTELHRHHLTWLARVLKAINYIAFRAILPYEVELGRGVKLWHRGLGVVVHPNTTIGDNVGIGHMVTISGVEDGEPTRIGNDVRIGSHAMLLPRAGRGVAIGHNARVGASSVVTRDVPNGGTVAGNPARATTQEEI